nr:hypothetical protein [Deltaproteobacteria bacterium]
MMDLWLPEDFRVYVSPDGGVANVPYEGSEERVLATVNLYQGEDGGYVAVYSRHAEAGVYSVGGGIYVVGQVRLRGRYVGRVFHPTGFEQRDISAASEIAFVCNQAFGGGDWECWGGGDTGGWFGFEG